LFSTQDVQSLNCLITSEFDANSVTRGSLDSLGTRIGHLKIDIF